MNLAPEKLTFLVSYQSKEAVGGEVLATYFVAKHITFSQLVVNEGELIIVDPKELGSIWRRMTPGTSFALRTFFLTENPEC